MVKTKLFNTTMIFIIIIYKGADYSERSIAIGFTLFRKSSLLS